MEGAEYRIEDAVEQSRSDAVAQSRSDATESSAHGFITSSHDNADTDITAFLEMLGAATEQLGTATAEVTPPAPADTLVDRETVLAALPTATGAGAPVAAAVEQPVYADEPKGEIDPALTPESMLTLIYEAIRHKGIAGHHLDSFNSFATVGIRQIVTKVFSVEGRLKNQRDKTEEDRAVAEINFKVEFTNAELRPPITNKYKSGTPQMLTPNMARIKNLTYSCPLYISASISATATYKDGTTRTKTGEVKDHRIAEIPCMVGSVYCNTATMTRAQRKEAEEDPNNPGGQFIIKGFEWTIDNLENITNNSFHVFRNAWANEIARGTFLSKPGDYFENSYQVILRYLVNGAITVELTTNKTVVLEIPFYIVFRALGMTRDYEIMNHIVYGVENTDPTTKQMLEILARAMEAPDEKFGPIRRSVSHVEIIAYIAQKLTEGANTANARRDDNIAKYLNNNILQIIDRHMFPHIGTSIEHRRRKLRFLGLLINKLLGVVLGITKATDRDSLAEKRIHSAGTSVAKTFKTDFNIAVVQQVKKAFMSHFKSTPFDSVQLVQSFINAINGDNLGRVMVQSITMGARATITLGQTEVTNRISSQMVYYKNDLNVKSILNTINTPNTSASKQNERADEMRRVQPTYIGNVDPTQSADTGEKVGTTKQMTCTVIVCGASSSYVIKDKLLNDSDIIPLDDVDPAAISRDKLAKVFVNGDWVGCCRRSHELARKYRMIRRHGGIHRQTTIVWEALVREVKFWTDVGRLTRPLIIVYNNIEEYMESHRRGGDRSVKFTQWIKLTTKHIRGLQTHRINMDDLLRERVVEYISAEEQENTFIAPSITTLREHVGDLRHMYTHCDIEQALFGLITLASPMANHASATRITYYTNHRKQSAGWFALNHAYRIDKNVSFQHYCERPLISTLPDTLTYPNGMNCIVALMLHGGYNQEDSVTLNRTAVDIGLFNLTFYRFEKAELEQGEHYGNADYARTMDMKKDATYAYTKNGFVEEGTLVERGHVLIVKTAKIPKPIDQYTQIDKSIVYKSDEPARVVRVVTPRDAEDALIAKVKLASNRPIGPGDKVSSRHGNKGVIGIAEPRNNMPYCFDDGLVPDLIVNAHSIPTRMAINQITECMLAQVAAMRGIHIDATSFRKFDFEAAMKMLEEYGIKYGGHRIMYNGRTGEPIDTLIFIGPTCYQRLQKFVVDEQYATRTCPTSATTKQPIPGKGNDGSLRLGEMEGWVIASHGEMDLMQTKLYKDSDGMTLPICRGCGTPAIVNEKLGIYKCRQCGDAADIARVASSHGANLFFHEANAMNTRISFELEPHIYARAAPADK